MPFHASLRLESLCESNFSLPNILRPPLSQTILRHFQILDVIMITMYAQRGAKKLLGSCRSAHMQGGRLQIGAPTGTGLMVVVYRGKHDPVSCELLSLCSRHRRAPNPILID